MLGEHPFKPRARVTHNKEFTDKMKQLGIHCAPEGFHFKVADRDGPFGILMAEWGIEPPDDVPKEETKIHWFRDGKEQKGRSTLSKWSCECGQNIRVGKKDWPGAQCNECGSQYMRADLHQIHGEGPEVYQAGQEVDRGRHHFQENDECLPAG